MSFLTTSYSGLRAPAKEDPVIVKNLTMKKMSPLVWLKAVKTNAPAPTTSHKGNLASSSSSSSSCAKAKVHCSGQSTAAVQVCVLPPMMRSQDKVRSWKRRHQCFETASQLRSVYLHVKPGESPRRVATRVLQELGVRADGYVAKLMRRQRMGTGSSLIDVPVDAKADWITRGQKRGQVPVFVVSTTRDKYSAAGYGIALGRSPVVGTFDPDGAAALEVAADWWALHAEAHPHWLHSTRDIHGVRPTAAEATTVPQDTDDGAATTESTAMESLPFMMNVKKHPNVYAWHGCIRGPPASLYAGGVFFFEALFPLLHPSAHPKVVFLTRILHPAVSPSTGIVFADAIGRRWGKSHASVTGLCRTLEALLQDPENAYLPFGDEFNVAKMCRDTPHHFREKARIWTEKYAQTL